MPEMTNPQPGVTQEAPSIEQRMQSLLQSEDQVEAPASPQEPEGQPEQTAEQPTDQVDLLAPEDLEEPQPEQSAVDAFEIVHQGQQIKLTREEAIKYAQQGVDYTQKTQALAQKDRAVSQQLQVLAQVSQVHPQLLEKRAQLTALGSQLAQYQNFNWVQLASTDPIGYAPARAQYDMLVQAYQQAEGDYRQTEHAVGQHLQVVREQRTQAEYGRLPELVPEWANPQKRQAGEAQVAKHFAETYGLQPQELSAALGGSALALATAYKAMKYDQLVRAKGDKVNQLRTKPPVTVPGAAQSTTARADKEVQLKQRLKKTGSREDAMAVLLNRM